MEELGAKHPESLPILEFWAAVYNELNRESQYFEVLDQAVRRKFQFRQLSEVLVKCSKDWWTSIHTIIAISSAWKNCVGTPTKRF